MSVASALRGPIGAHGTRTAAAGGLQLVPPHLGALGAGAFNGWSGSGGGGALASLRSRTGAGELVSQLVPIAMNGSQLNAG